MWSVFGRSRSVCGLCQSNQLRDTYSACRIPRHSLKRVNVNRMDQTRRLDCGSKADCRLKYTADLRFADAVSNVSYRYLNNKLGGDSDLDTSHSMGVVDRELCDTPTWRLSMSSTSWVIAFRKSETMDETLTAMAEYLRLDSLIS